jgi:hypothetical protein
MAMGGSRRGSFGAASGILDYDGDGIYTLADKTYTFTYQAGDLPVVGDWSGSGTAKIGIYRNGFWVLDYNGNGVYDGGVDKFYGFGGAAPQYRPIVGDWNGDGRTKVGFYTAGFWVLDTNGNGSFDGTAAGQDQVIGFWGNASDQILIGKW